MLFFDSFDHWGKMRPEQIFCIDDGGEISYGEAYLKANKIANGFLDLGLKAGDHIAFLSKNSANLLLMYMGAAKVGLIPVPLNYRLAPAEWAYILNDSGAKLIYAEVEYGQAIEGIANDVPSLTIRIAEGNVAGWISYDKWWNAATDKSLERTIDDQQQLYQMYTSGTTGHPKGVVINHRSFYNNLSQYISVMVSRPGVGDVGLVVSPLYHAAAVYIASLQIQLGMTIILHREFDPVKVVADMDNRQVAFTFLVPAMIQECLVKVADIADRDWSQLKGIMYGASPIAISVLRKAMEVFECDFYQAYGLTETTAILTILDARDHEMALEGNEKLLLSAGRSLPGTQLKIADGDGQKVANGVMGEICGRGDQIMAGYWNLAEATEKTLIDGWMHTGDAGIMDDEGYVYIQDRIKDMVVSGGENIYPREVENILFSHDKIIDAAVIGVPDDKYGEALLAFVVTDDGIALPVEDIINFCRGYLGGYKVPRQIEFVKSLPRNASGKVLKKDLRQPYWNEDGRGVG